MISEPCISGEAEVIAMVGVLIGLAGFVAIGFAAQATVASIKVFRDAKIGRRFRELNQCDHARAIALLEVIEAATVDAMIGEAFRHNDRNYEFTSDYRLRLAKFSEDCQ